MNRLTIVYEGLEQGHFDVLNKRLAGVEVSWIERTATSPALDPSADVLIVKDLDLSEDDVAQAKQLRLVAQLDPGSARLDETVLSSAGIAFERMRWPALVGVAEHAILLMLGVIKKLVGSVERVRSHQYPSSLQPKETTQTEYAFNWTEESGLGVLYRRTLGIVGLGWIGREVAKRAAGFGMEILYHDPNPLEEREEAALGVTRVSFEDLLRRSDVLSLHTRLTPETERMIDKDALERMKPTAVLINTARGRLVDEQALIEALQTGRLAGAGLDVFWMEPPERDNPLLTMENVLVTPHDAGLFIGDANHLVGGYIADAIDTQVLNQGAKG